MNNKGFIATSLIYSFFLVFCAVLVSYVGIFMHNKILLDNANRSIRTDLSSSYKLSNEKIKVGDYLHIDNLTFSFGSNSGDISNINWIIIKKTSTDITVVSDGIITSTIGTSGVDNLNNIITNYLDFGGACNAISNKRVLSLTDMNDSIVPLKNSSKEIYEDIVLKPSIDYYLDSASKNQFFNILDMKVATVMVNNTTQINGRAAFEISPNLLTKGGRGTSINPYILTSCAL